MIRHDTVPVGRHTVFYREAGDPSKPTLLLLHGFPASSLMFRELMLLLQGDYHLLAPDLPGFGFTASPGRDEFAYTFDALADVVEGFLRRKEVDRYAMYVFDYGAPVGWRLALRHPARISAIVSQNGNAYLDGLTEAWAPIRQFWQSPTDASRTAIRQFYATDAVRFQYLHGVADPARVAPETYTLDHALLSRPGMHDIQLDLMLDYRTNVERYPEFQQYFRTARPPILCAWGKQDPFFAPAGARAFQRDQPDTEVIFYDTGHFALETHADDIAHDVQAFLRSVL